MSDTFGHAPQDASPIILSERYRLLHKIGDGGMGRVYAAEHVTLGRRLAIKILRDELSRDPGNVERFLLEAQAASMIDHVNVVDIIDFGRTPSGSVFFAMEYLEGEDLAALMKREGRLPWSQVQSIAVQVARGLRAAHSKGVVHRDMTPGNIFLVDDEFGGSKPQLVKLLDFGIAKLTGTGRRPLTLSGSVFGTARYISPEQAQGLEVDARSDIYAVGIVMYQMLTGHTPFEGGGFLEIAARHIEEMPKPVREMAPDAVVSDQVEELVMRALEKDPADRFADMGELEAALMSASIDTTMNIDNPLLAGGVDQTVVHDAEYGRKIREERSTTIVQAPEVTQGYEVAQQKPKSTMIGIAPPAKTMVAAPGKRAPGPTLVGRETSDTVVGPPPSSATTLAGAPKPTGATVVMATPGQGASKTAVMEVPPAAQQTAATVELPVEAKRSLVLPLVLIGLAVLLLGGAAVTWIYLFKGDTDAKVVLGPDRSPTPEPEPEPEPEADPNPNPNPNPGSDADAKADADPKVDADAKADPVPVPDAKADVETKADADTKADPVPEADPDPVPEADPDPVPEADPDPVPEADPDPVVVLDEDPAPTSKPSKPRRKGVVNGFAKARAAIKACGRTHGAAPGSTLQVEFDVSRGRSINVTVKGQHAGTPLGTCVADAIEKRTHYGRIEFVPGVRRTVTF